jgi:hypothetical protein
MGTVEAVEKVPKQILGRDAEKSDLIECATINDLMFKKSQEGPPENIVVTCLKNFSHRPIRCQAYEPRLLDCVFQK